jgi:hypothetical protein
MGAGDHAAQTSDEPCPLLLPTIPASSACALLPTSSGTIVHAQRIVPPATAAVEASPRHRFRFIAPSSRKLAPLASPASRANTAPSFDHEKSIFFFGTCKRRGAFWWDTVIHRATDEWRLHYRREGTERPLHTHAVAPRPAESPLPS